jgi:hypothetical protein
MFSIWKLTKQFSQKHGQTFKAVDNVNLTVPEGEMCVLLGPSGCGKTTTLKMINRLITPSSGTILINGEDTSGMDTVTLRRNIGYVIQQIGLFPNMTIEENITVVPRMLGWDKARCKTRAEELMDMVAMDPHKFLNRYPREMSEFAAAGLTPHFEKNVAAAGNRNETKTIEKSGETNPEDKRTEDKKHSEDLSLESLAAAVGRLHVPRSQHAYWAT